jgi:hypothetical protein
MFDIHAYLFVNMVIFIVDNFLNYFLNQKIDLTTYIYIQTPFLVSIFNFLGGSLKLIF